MSLKREIIDTYYLYEDFLQKKTGRAIDSFEMSEIRDYFLKLLNSKNKHFENITHAEDTFLYLYHYRELMEVKRILQILREMSDQNLYQRFLMEFFDDSSPSGLQDLKVHQINNESDKIWFSKEKSSNETIDSWRKERFAKYI